MGRARRALAGAALLPGALLVALLFSTACPAMVNWIQGGVAVCTAVGVQAAPQLIPDGTGGAVIAWEDYLSWTNSGIYAQNLGNSVFYFAEGYTGPGFQEYLALGNPGSTEATATITYLYKDGGTKDQTVKIPPNSRATVNVNVEAREGQEVSARIVSEQEIIAERPMYFNYNGVWTGGSDAVGATTTSYLWYFAEGHTSPDFQEYLCVLNPGDAQANLTFFFQTEEEGLKVIVGQSVPPHSRGSFKANDLLSGKTYNTSLMLTSNQPVVAERPCYFDYLSRSSGQHWTGGHCVAGTPTLSKSYYFAEGTTRSGFEEWLTLQNPNPIDITVAATYQPGENQGQPVARTYSVPAGRRKTLYVPDEAGSGKDVSIQLSSQNNFLAERPCYFSYLYAGLAANGGHCVIGATSPASEWFLAEGYTGPGFQQWLCLQNPGDTPAVCEITYYIEGDAALQPKLVTVDPKTRKTLMVNEEAGPNYGLSTRVRVTSGPPIVVERPMYFVFRGWDGGHDVVGYAP